MLVGTNHISGMADRLTCCQLKCDELITIVGHQFIDICVQRGGREVLRRAGLSVAAETLALSVERQSAQR